jgi:hypothetical protein
MQQVAFRGQIEGLITDWCATNGFGSEPVTISTFTELATNLLNVLSDGVPQREDVPLMRSTVLLAHEDLLTDIATDEPVTNNLLSPHDREEDLGTQNTMVLQTALPEIKAGGRADEPSLFTRLFREASGDWRVVFDDDCWWAVGHHFVHPATDRNHAERLCRELSNEHLQS